MTLILDMQGNIVPPPKPWEITILLDEDTDEKDVVELCNSLIASFYKNKINADVSYGRLGEEPEEDHDTDEYDDL